MQGMNSNHEESKYSSDASRKRANDEVNGQADYANIDGSMIPYE